MPVRLTQRTGLLDIFEDIEPGGQHMYQDITERYNRKMGQLGLPPRDMAFLRAKIGKWINHRKPTGEGECPIEVRRARRVNRRHQRQLSMDGLGGGISEESQELVSDGESVMILTRDSNRPRALDDRWMERSVRAPLPPGADAPDRAIDSAAPSQAAAPGSTAPTQLSSAPATFSASASADNSSPRSDRETASGTVRSPRPSSKRSTIAACIARATDVRAHCGAAESHTAAGSGTKGRRWSFCIIAVGPGADPSC